jgi:hypothetical protein
MERAGFLMIGIAALIYSISTAYVEIRYSDFECQQWQELPH